MGVIELLGVIGQFLGNHPFWLGFVAGLAAGLVASKPFRNWWVRRKLLRRLALSPNGAYYGDKEGNRYCRFCVEGERPGAYLLELVEPKLTCICCGKSVSADLMTNEERTFHLMAMAERTKQSSR